MMADAPSDHHCPGCGALQKAFLRYPWYFCQTCLERAEDGAGNRLAFGNATAFGGLIWRHASEPDQWRDAIRVLCRIAGRPVVVSEARFGGVVAEPLREDGALDGTDLRRSVPRRDS